METNLFILWLVGLAGSLLILFYLVRSLIMKKEISDLCLKCSELQELYKKTQLKINQLRSEYGEPQEMVMEGLQGAGIGQILEALQVNPDMIVQLLPAKYRWAGPLVKGLIDGLKKGKEHGAQTETGFTSQMP